MACKNAKIAVQHPIIFGVLASPWTALKTEKIKNAFSWEMKSVSGHLKIVEEVYLGEWGGGANSDCFYERSIERISLWQVLEIALPSIKSS